MVVWVFFFFISADVVFLGLYSAAVAVSLHGCFFVCFFFFNCILSLSCIGV